MLALCQPKQRLITLPMQMSGFICPERLVVDGPTNVTVKLWRRSEIAGQFFDIGKVCGLLVYGQQSFRAFCALQYGLCHSCLCHSH